MHARAYRRMLLTVVLAGAAAGSACGPLPADPPHPAVPPALVARPVPPSLPGAGQTRVPGEYLVTLAQGADAAVISDVYGRLGAKQIRQLAPDMFLLTVRDDPGPDAMEALRRREPRIKAIQPNFVYRMQPAGGSQ